MPLLSKVGGFNIGSGTTGNLAITGVGFQPKVVIFWWSGWTTDNSAADFLHKRGFGVALSSSSRHCLASHSEDNPAAGDAGQAQFTDRCIAFLNDTEGDDGHADFVSMDSDGFTINRITAAFFNHRVNYLALGGAELQVARGSTNPTTGAGTVTVSGIAFPPVALLFMGQGSNLASSVDSRQSIGFAARDPDGVIGNGVWAGGSNNGSNPTVTASYCRSGECSASFSSDVTAIDLRGSVDQFNADGFRLNFAESIASSRTIYWLALGGIQAKVASTLSATNTSPIPITGIKFRPQAGIFLSANASEDAADTPHSDDKWSMGCFGSTGGLNDGDMAVDDENGVTPADIFVEADAAGSIYSNLRDGIIGFGTVDSLDADGLTWHMVDDDSAANFITTLFLGEQTQPAHRRWLNVAPGLGI